MLRSADSGSSPRIGPINRSRYASAAATGLILRASSPGAPATALGWLLNGVASTSSRLDAGSVLTSSTRRPARANRNAHAHESEVLPTPPLPVKKRNRVEPAASGLYNGRIIPPPPPDPTQP